MDTWKELDNGNILLQKQQRVQDEHETAPHSTDRLNAGCIRAYPHRILI